MVMMPMVMRVRVMAFTQPTMISMVRVAGGRVGACDVAVAIAGVHTAAGDGGDYGDAGDAGCCDDVDVWLVYVLC